MKNNKDSYNFSKKLCLETSVNFDAKFLDPSGMPNILFYKKIAQAIGGIGYSKMDIFELPRAISTRLGVDFPPDCQDAQGSVNSTWFNLVIPKLANFFVKYSASYTQKDVIRFEGFGDTEGERTLRETQHIKREQKIVKKLKEECDDRDTFGFIYCYICRIAPGARHGVEVIEAHHIIPISKAGKRVPRLEDFLLLCPNCHSSVHAGAKIEITPKK